MHTADLAIWLEHHGDARPAIGFLAWWYPWARATLLGELAPVPCDGCGAQCCRSTAVYLLEDVDDPTRYQTITRDGRAYLARRPDGACVHLTEDDRCGVHERPPLMCAVFDCRVYPAGGFVIVEPDTGGELTLACEAGLTQFQIVARTPADRVAMAAAHAEALRLADTMDAAAALGAGLLTWPRITGGPAAAYLRQLERATPLRDAVLHRPR